MSETAAAIREKPRPVGPSQGAGLMLGSSKFSQGDHASRNPEVAIGSYSLFDPQHGPNTNVVLRFAKFAASTIN